MQAIFIALVLAYLTNAVAARGLLTEQQAHAKAVMILKGEPYGETYSQISQRIRSATLSPDSMKECGKGRSPAWIFHVRVQKEDLPDHMDKSSDIAGPLVLSAATGKIICAGLPFLN